MGFALFQHASSANIDSPLSLTNGYDSPLNALDSLPNHPRQNDLFYILAIYNKNNHSSGYAILKSRCPDQGKGKFASWPVSRVLYGSGPKAGTWQPFIWDNACALPPATHPDDWPGKGRTACAVRVIPIRSCSRWGLPCHPCCHARGGLLPHPFTLTCRGRRYSLCGTFPGVAPAGRYPAPFFRGARTFLPPQPFGPSGARLPGQLAGGA
jgi:hypothetical protein